MKSATKIYCESSRARHEKRGLGRLMCVFSEALEHGSSVNRDSSFPVITLIGVYVNAPAFDDLMREVDNIARFSPVPMDSGSIGST